MHPVFIPLLHMYRDAIITMRDRGDYKQIYVYQPEYMPVVRNLLSQYGYVADEYPYAECGMGQFSILRKKS